MRVGNLIRVSSLTLFAAAVLGAASGCSPAAPRPATQLAVPTADQVAAVRQAFEQAEPGTLVGDVTEVLPQEQLAAVRDVSTQEFKEGDLVQFVDINKQIINHGHVLKILPDVIHVKYDAPGADDPRAPRVGDLMVKLKS